MRGHIKQARSGLVASLGRPGGNVTGVTFFTIALGAKRLELLEQLVPGATSFALIVNPKSPNGEAQIRDAQASAPATGRRLHVIHASTEQEIDLASEAIVQQKTDALLVGTNPFFTSQRDRLVKLAARQPHSGNLTLREDAIGGGLMSYGASIADAHRVAGIYTGRILKGAKPADIPVDQPTRFELVVYLKAAKALGIEIPATVLARADEVIE